MELASNLSSLQIEETKMEEESSSVPDNTQPMSSSNPVQDSPAVSSRPTRQTSKRLCATRKKLTSTTHLNGNILLNKLKRLEHNLDTDQKICLFYTNVNKNWKTKHTNLETIFEEPKESGDGNEVTMSKARLRRSLIFNNRITKAKKEKRRKAITKNKSEVIKAKIAKSGV